MTELGFHEDGSFRFHIPAELEKSKDGQVRIKGIASVESPDLAEETVIQKGMDISYLLNRGFFNDNHSKETAGKVGIPTVARTTPKGLYVEGYLLDTPRAKAIVDLAEALKKAGGDRKLGFSVEGKITKRNGKIIEKSWVKDIAITAEPYHPGTYLEIVKSITDQIGESGTAEDDGLYPVNGEEIRKSFKGISLVKDLRDMANRLEKAIEAGHDRPAESGGGALRKQDLESDLKNQDIPGAANEDEEKKRRKTSITKTEARDHILKKGYSTEAADKMVELIFDAEVRDFLQIIEPI